MSHALAFVSPEMRRDNDSHDGSGGMNPWQGNPGRRAQLAVLTVSAYRTACHPQRRRRHTWDSNFAHLTRHERAECRKPAFLLVIYFFAVFFFRCTALN